MDGGEAETGGDFDIARRTDKETLYLRGVRID